MDDWAVDAGKVSARLTDGRSRQRQITAILKTAKVAERFMFSPEEFMYGFTDGPL